MTNATRYPSSSKGVRGRFILVVAMLFVLCVSAQATYVSVSGYAKLPDGTPVPGLMLVCSTSAPIPMMQQTQSNGSFSFPIEVGDTYCIVAQPADPEQWDSIVGNHWTCGQTAWGQNTLLAFTAYPMPHVRGIVNDVSGYGFAMSGIRVLVDGVAVTTTDANGEYSFLLGDGANDIPRDGALTFQKTFFDFSDQGLHYSAPSWQSVTVRAVSMYFDQPVSDYNVGVSWDLRQGEGWEYFPVCPQHDIENNPNVYADLIFDNGYLTTIVPASHLRITASDPTMIGVGAFHAQNNVGDEFADRAIFSTPVNACGRSELRMQAGIELADGELSWWTMSCIETGASTLDLLEDGVVNLADVGVYSKAALSAENYDPCCDFNSDGVINLVDTQVLAGHLGHSESKSIERWECVEHPRGVLRSEWRRDGGSSELSIELHPGCKWIQAEIELPVDGVSVEDLRWTSAVGFAGEAIVSADGDGRVHLMVFSEGSSSGGRIGVVRFPDSRQEGDAQLLNITQSSKSNDQDVDDDPARETRVWSSRSVGNATVQPLEVRFQLDQSSVVSVCVFDIRGRSVTSLVGGEHHGAGQYLKTWNGRDSGGRHVSAGTYFARVSIDDRHYSQRLVVVR